MQTQFITTFARWDSPATLAELTRMRQQPGETADQFLQRFRRIHLRCKTVIPEDEIVIIAQDALDTRIRKKIEGNRFQDLYEFSKRASRYETLLQRAKVLFRPGKNICHFRLAVGQWKNQVERDGKIKLKEVQKIPKNDRRQTINLSMAYGRKPNYL